MTGIGTPYDDLVLGINYDGKNYESNLESKPMSIYVDHQLLTNL